MSAARRRGERRDRSDLHRPRAPRRRRRRPRGARVVQRPLVDRARRGTARGARRRSRRPTPARRGVRTRGSACVFRPIRRSAKHPFSSVMRTLRGPISAIASSAMQEVVVVLELLSDELLGLPLVRRDEERPRLDAESQRLALAVEHDPHVATREVAHRFGVERGRAPCAAASRTRTTKSAPRERYWSFSSERLELDRRRPPAPTR